MSIFSFFSNSAQNTSIKILDRQSFKDAIQSNEVQLIDVRTPKEYVEGRIKNAINIDFFNSEKFEIEFEKLNKEQPVFLYCHSGNRSQKAAKKISNLGFKKIYDLQGGYLNWN